MKKNMILMMMLLVVFSLMTGCSDDANGVTGQKSNDVNLNPADDKKNLTITKKSMLRQLVGLFPDRLCNSSNGAKLNMNSEQCMEVAHTALTDCISMESNHLPKVIEIDKSKQSQQIIGLLKPIFSCTKNKMNIPEQDKIAIRLNFEFNTSK